MRNKIAELIIMIAVNWVATPEFRRWWNEDGDEHKRESDV